MPSTPSASSPSICSSTCMDHVELQIEGLLAEGVEGIHLYALNRLATVERLGPKLKEASGAKFTYNTD